MGVNKVLTGHGAPVAHDGAFDVFPLQGRPEHGIIQQIELAHREIIGRPPICVQLVELVCGKDWFTGEPLWGSCDGSGRVLSLCHTLASFIYIAGSLKDAGN
ncbi:hypothetical protein SDC9_83986 [bioreactor metagenome]|uniref:Uncharacterized protein n=1 Tax=bioreactor metagenome TaxID=1076179 RepID=A0A644Z906_9ZZZZ